MLLTMQAEQIMYTYPSPPLQAEQMMYTYPREVRIEID